MSVSVHRGLILALVIAPVSATERQLTHAPHGHVLTNINVWSPDSRWIVNDVRSADRGFDGTRIEQVNVDTGEVQRLYDARNGAACGVVTYHPREPKVIFIHGPERPAPDWSYGAARRRGAIVDTRRPGEARPLDAMTYAPPFVPGALRGGSHVHVFSPDGAGQLAFLMKDDAGIVQLWTVPARGGELRQVTRNPAGIASAFTWSPDGRRIAHTMDGAVCTTDIATGTTARLTGGRTDAGSPEPLACVFSPAGRHIAFMRPVMTMAGTFAQVFVVSVPSP